MTKKESLQLFEEKKVRTVWDDKEERTRDKLSRVKTSCLRRQIRLLRLADKSKGWKIANVSSSFRCI